MPKTQNSLLRFTLHLVFFIIVAGCQPEDIQEFQALPSPTTEAIVLGIAQDAGYPQANCQKSCCRPAWSDFEKRKRVSCLAITDSEAGKAWLLDATPDFPEQLQFIRDSLQLELGGILLTHAHIGHYTGLMHLGREVMGAKKVPVYAMPRLADFLHHNGPWSQLIELENIDLIPLTADTVIELSPNLIATPFLVPHRGEFSETVGFSVQGPNKRMMFLPDIDKWEHWKLPADSMVSAHDLAFLDATFFSGAELPGRDMSKIPHPTVLESLAFFAALPDSNKNSIHFIHLNHSNPLLQPDSPERRKVIQAGFNVSDEGSRFAL